MSLKKKKTFSLLEIGTLILIIFSLFLMATTIINRIPLQHALLYFIFQILGIFLPGAMLLNIINIPQKDILVFLSLSYAFGYIITIIEYFFLMATNLSAHSIMLMFLVGLLSILYFWRKRKTNLFTLAVGKKYAFFFLALLSASLIFTFFLSNLNNLSPQFANNEDYFHLHPDVLFWMQNVASATRSFPMEHPHMTDTVFHYHAFAALHTALASDMLMVSVMAEWSNTLLKW